MDGLIVNQEESLTELTRIQEELKMYECLHIETYYNLDGEELERRWNRIFCPDCGVRLEAPGPTRPFKLKDYQRWT